MAETLEAEEWRVGLRSSLEKTEYLLMRNVDVEDLVGEPNIIGESKSARLRCLGHVERMGEDRAAKRAYLGQPTGRRPIGRPRYRWLYEVRKDLCDMQLGGGPQSGGHEGLGHGSEGPQQAQACKVHSKVQAHKVHNKGQAHKVHSKVQVRKVRNKVQVRKVRSKVQVRKARNRAQVRKARNRAQVRKARNRAQARKFYLDVENQDRVNHCRVFARPKLCCLTVEDQGCDAMQVYGENVEIIKPKDRKTLVFIHPTVFQHDKTGFCAFALNYKCGRKLAKRQLFNITFDTRLSKLGKKSKMVSKYVEKKKIEDCESIDQNSLENCSPVDCNVKYTDEKSYYDQNLNRCVKAVRCVGDTSKDMPDTVYLQDVNFCRDLLHPIEIQDVYAMSHGLGVVTPKPKLEAELIANLQTNCTTVSQQMGLLKDMMSGKLCPHQKGICVDFSRPCLIAILSIVGYIFGIAAVIVSFACCVHTLAWCHGKWDRKDPPVVIQRTFSTRNSNIKNNLLREVITHDIPLELRSSVIDVCDRVGKEVKWQKRYRVADIGRIGLDREASECTSSTSTLQIDSEED
ncbi:uncharacterized protein [Choristoneura fumiferana]|uniref:uncharacterized protein n=1 Tax=Choristoneura fumiferana TaxID=7141 RepID=UPI003D156119